MLLKPSRKGNRGSFLNSEMLLLGAVTALAALLRISYLTSKSLWMDEGFSIYLGQASTAGFLQFIRGGELNMVFYYELLRGWMHFGKGEFFIRLLSVIPSVATVPVVYRLALRLFERRLALMAALLAALNPALITYAQEVRGYALAVFLISLSSLFFLRLVERPRWTNWTAYVLFTALAVYSHMFAALVVPAQWTSYLFSSRRDLPWRTIVKTAMALALTLAPMTIFVLTRHSAVANWIPRPTWPGMVELLHFLTLPKYGMIVYLLLWGAALWAAFQARGRGEKIWPYQFLFAWLFLPVLIAVTISFYKPVLVPRFLLICVPAAVLVAAAGICFLRPWAQVLALAVTALASFNSVLSYYRHPQLKEDWRGASHYVSSQSQTGDEIVVLPGYGQFTFDYYFEAEQPAPAFSQFADADTVVGSSHSSGQRIWLVVYAGSNAQADEIIEKLRTAPRNSYCELKSKKLNFIQVWLLARCERSAAQGK